MRTTIRTYSSRDLPSIVDIEKSLPQPLDAIGVQRFLNKRRHGCVVLCCRKKVVGYMLYAWSKLSYHIVSLVVCQESRREGIGTAAIKWLVGIGKATKKTAIECSVQEHRVALQCFLRSTGFTLIEVEKRAGLTDMYRFQRRLN